MGGPAGTRQGGAACRFRRRAAMYWFAGWVVGAGFLPDRDPRRVCGLANAACALRRLGLGRAAMAAHSLARKRWSAAEAAADKAVVSGRARSSLFHLRLARLHGETYADVARSRLKELQREAAEWMVAPVPEMPDGECRWVVERPPVYDDTRKLIAACCLLACAQPRRRIESNGSGRSSSAGRLRTQACGPCRGRMTRDGCHFPETTSLTTAGAPLHPPPRSPPAAAARNTPGTRPEPAQDPTKPRDDAGSTGSTGRPVVAADGP